MAMVKGQKQDDFCQLSILSEMRWDEFQFFLYMYLIPATAVLMPIRVTRRSSICSVQRLTNSQTGCERWHSHKRRLYHDLLYATIIKVRSQWSDLHGLTNNSQLMCGACQTGLIWILFCSVDAPNMYISGDHQNYRYCCARCIAGLHCWFYFDLS